METNAGSGGQADAPIAIEKSEALSLRNLGYRVAFDELGVKDDPAKVGLLTQEDKDYYEKLRVTDYRRYDLAFQGYIDILNDY